MAPSFIETRRGAGRDDGGAGRAGSVEGSCAWHSVAQLSQIFESTRQMTLAEASEFVVKQLDEARGSTPLADDLTFVTIGYLGDQAATGG